MAQASKRTKQNRRARVERKRQEMYGTGKKAQNKRRQARKEMAFMMKQNMLPQVAGGDIIEL